MFLKIKHVRKTGAGCAGLEPAANWLTANCSTTELTPQVSNFSVDETAYLVLQITKASKALYMSRQ